MSRAQCLVVALAATATLIVPSLTSAQVLGTDKAVTLVNLDLTVPDSPAFVMLGLSPEKLVRPSAPKDLATTILNGVDDHGNVQSGLAVDFAPLFLFAGNRITYADYRDHRRTQILGRLQVSAATAKGASDSDRSVRVAVGARTTLWDKGDPRLDADLVACLDAIDVPVPTRALLTQKERDAWEAEQTIALKPKVAACQKASASRQWNASSLAIGVAPVFQSPTGRSSDFEYAGAAVWGSFAYKLSSFGQFVAQGRYRNREMVPDRTSSGSFFEQDSGGLGLRLTLGEPIRAFIVESEIERQSPQVGDPTTTVTLSGGGQLKLSDDLWLSASVGGALTGSGNEQRGMFVLSSFKWALSREPSVKAP